MSLPLLGLIVFDLLLAWWIGKWAYHTFFLDKAGKKRLVVGKMLHQFKHKHQWDRDELSEEQLAELTALTTEAEELIKEKAGVRKVDKWMQDAGKRWHGLLKYKSGHAARETVEVLVVVVGVVMGLRGLYLQPFKIPTGSMRPTLFGIHFVHDDEVKVPSFPKRVLDGVNYSRRYVDAVAKQEGIIPIVAGAGGGQARLAGIRKAPSLPVVGFFLPKTQIEIGGVTYEVPGDPGNVQRYLLDAYNKRSNYFNNDGRPVLLYKQGDPILQGYYQLGDHLFVDRVSYHFREPRRGDIVVFITDGVIERGNGMSGRYYIKRLVGLPGETLQIRDRRLYVKAQGESEFRLVDSSDDPAFERIYSMKGGNRGYSHPSRTSGGRYLLDADDEFELGKDEYFMMGDNSENSADSRFWGVVERDEIVGRAFVVYWPFLRRWGLPDRVSEEAFDSPPTR